MRAFRFWRREQRKKKRIFVCPVCHLELSMADLDKEGYTVCPVCSVVLEVVISNGFPLPVVHDVEIKRDQPKFRTHSTSTHLSIGLLPVALLFSVIALIMGQTSHALFSYIEKLAFLLFLGSLAGSFLSFGTGFMDWKKRYRGRPYSVITTKIRLSIVFWIIGIIAAIVKITLVDIDTIVSPAYVVFLVMQVSMLWIVATVGHIGGNLVFGK